VTMPADMTPSRAQDGAVPIWRETFPPSECLTEPAQTMWGDEPHSAAYGPRESIEGRWLPLAAYQALVARGESADKVREALDLLCFAIEARLSAQAGVDEARTFDGRGFATGALTSAESREASALVHAREALAALPPPVPREEVRGG
jgi:hypothetical protein